MTIDTTIVKRFAELEKQIKSIHPHSEDGSFASYNSDQWQQWATSAHHLLRVAFGDTSPHYRNFAKVYEACHGYDNQVDALRGVFLAAKADYEGGYAFEVEALISGEIYGDF